MLEGDLLNPWHRLRSICSFQYNQIDCYWSLHLHEDYICNIEHHYTFKSFQHINRFEIDFYFNQTIQNHKPNIFTQITFVVPLLIKRLEGPIQVDFFSFGMPVYPTYFLDHVLDPSFSTPCFPEDWHLRGYSQIPMMWIFWRDMVGAAPCWFVFWVKSSPLRRELTLKKKSLEFSHLNNFWSNEVIFICTFWHSLVWTRFFCLL